MAHIHTLSDGTPTGSDIRDINNLDLHWHEAKGAITSSDRYGEGHTHQFQGMVTSAPINIDGNTETSSGHDDEDDKIIAMRNIETKAGYGQTLEIKQEAVNGVPVGVVQGYIATWDLDRDKDKFVKGAFTESLADLRERNRPIRFKDHHDRTIGGFPIYRVFEDDKGLFGEGQINLTVQQGREAFSLAKQGILSDFSVGYSVEEFEIDRDIRIIKKAIIWEGSLVDEPMNPAANVTEVKAAVPFQDLPIAERSQKWDRESADSRIREFTGSNEQGSAEYRKAFIFLGAHKLPLADVINGRMMAVPRAIFDAAEVLQGAQGKVDIPEVDRPKVICHLERYYAKMGLDSPFKDKQYFVSDDVKTWASRDLEKFLRGSGGMSKSAAKILASRIDKGDGEGYKEGITNKSDDWDKVLGQIESISI